uniref:Uncharacterized protein n=1 Tax=Oryza brachyantha TaxID=4533 RepID=J3LQW5_ORYBR
MTVHEHDAPLGPPARPLQHHLLQRPQIFSGELRRHALTKNQIPFLTIPANKRNENCNIMTCNPDSCYCKGLQ